ncbi:MAG: signal peptidase I [Clostridia bacterium]|nr:signal peptidase I [Clostridia bacterium]
MERLELRNFGVVKKKIESIVIDAILYTLAIYVLIFLIVYSSAVVYDVSMQPTLNKYSAVDKDVVYYNKYAEIERGDIVIVGKGEEEWLIKRVIAFEGEKIRYQYNSEIGEYQLYLNNRLYEEDYIKESITRDKLKVENDKYNNFADISDSSGYNPLSLLKITQPNSFDDEGNYIVPQGCLFLMGDNRIHSTDSKSMGGIKNTDIQGVVELIIPKGENVFWNVINFIF